MDDLLADFVAETREMLEASSGEIVAWEADPSDTARLDTIFRFVHTHNKDLLNFLLMLWQCSNSCI